MPIEKHEIFWHHQIFTLAQRVETDWLIVPHATVQQFFILTMSFFGNQLSKDNIVPMLHLEFKC